MTKADKILRALAGGAWVPNWKLNRICFRYSSRIFDLRARGYEFETKRGKSAGLVFYRRVR
jgi:hypothetical protein